jgi:tetratricopeptide (TPR) repeat protein
MPKSRASHRAILATLSLLAASALDQPAAWAAGPLQTSPPEFSGVFSAFLNGHFAASEADSVTAAREYLRAVADMPATPELVRQALLAAIMSGSAEAVGLARQLPNEPMAQILLGSEAARTGDWQTALLRFDSLPQNGPTRLLRPLLAAWAEQGAGQTDHALARLEPLLNEPRFRSAYGLHAALIADQAGRTADAARYYEIAEADNAARPLRLAQILASFAARQGREADALRILDSTARATPVLRISLPALASALHQRPVPTAIDGIAEACLDLAGALHLENEDPFAMLLVQLALISRPDFAAARLVGSDILEAGRHPDRALEILTPVGAEDPLGAVVRLRRAELEGHLGQQTEALEQLKELSAAYTDSTLPDAEAGDLLRVAGDYPGAAAAYTRAIARITTPLEPDWPLFYDRGVAYEQANEWPQAEADFQTALQIEPNQPVVMNYLAYSWANRGEHLEEARRMLETAVQQRPDDGAIIDSLGWVMLRQGENEAATRMLERASELQPEDPTINGHLGDAYWAAGRKMEATYQWRRALTLNPLPADAAKLQAKLHETTIQASSQEMQIP